MKNLDKYNVIIWAGLIALLFSVSASAQKVPNYGINFEPVCWLTPGGVDSTIYAAWQSAVNTTKPTRLHYFNVQGNAVSVSGGTLRAGRCGSAETDSITILLDSIVIILDSIAGNTTQPQQCDCVYTLDLENHSYAIAINAQFPTWTYERVVTRNCGAGNEEVFRMQSVAQTSGLTGKAWTDYTNSTPSQAMISGSSIVDSIRLYSQNPQESFWVVLSPVRVAQKYPFLLINGLDTNDLRYNSAAPADMDNALTMVLNYGINQWALLHSPTLPAPNFDLDVLITNTGSLKFRTYIINRPTGLYVAINSTAGSRRMDWHRTNAEFIQSNGASFQGISWVVQGNYNTPCGDIATTYNGILTEGSATWDSVDIRQVANPTLSGPLGTITCTMTCPTAGSECVEVCNDDTNPIPVTIVASALEVPCPVRNVPSHRLLASQTVTYTTNSIHSIFLQVLSGTATVTITDPLGVATAVTYPVGVGSGFTAGECKLIQSSYQITATGGQTLVLAGY